MYTKKNKMLLFALSAFVICFGKFFYPYAYEKNSDILFVPEICLEYPIHEILNIQLLFIFERITSCLFIYSDTNVFLNKMAPYYICRGETHSNLYRIIQKRYILKSLAIVPVYAALCMIKDHGISPNLIYQLFELLMILYIEANLVLLISLSFNTKSDFAVFIITYTILLVFGCEIGRNIRIRRSFILERLVLLVTAVFLKKLTVHLLKKKEY